MKKTALLLLPLLLLGSPALALPQTLSEAGIETGIDEIDNCQLHAGGDPTNYNIANDPVLLANYVANGGTSPFILFYTQTWQLYGWVDGQWDYLVWGDVCG